jgi:hypothetical protein
MKEGPKRDHFTDISNIYGKSMRGSPKKRRDKSGRKFYMAL